MIKEITEIENGVLTAVELEAKPASKRDNEPYIFNYEDISSLSRMRNIKNIVAYGSWVAKTFGKLKCDKFTMKLKGTVIRLNKSSIFHVKVDNGSIVDILTYSRGSIGTASPEEIDNLCIYDGLITDDI